MAFHNPFTFFTITQPFLGAPLQFSPPLGSAELEQLVDAFVTGSSSKQDKFSEVTIDFYNNATVDLNTGALVKSYQVYNIAAASPWDFESPTLSQSSGFSPPIYTPSPASSAANLADSGYGSFSSMTPPVRSKTGAASGRVAKKSKKETKKAAEMRLPGFSIMTKDGVDVTNSAGRGTKTKEQREHAHLMRIMRACADCKRKKTKCDPSHRREFNEMSRTSTSATSSSSSSGSSRPNLRAPSVSTPPPSASQQIMPSFGNAIDDFVLFPEEVSAWNTDQPLPEDCDLGHFNFDISDIGALNQYPVANLDHSYYIPANSSQQFRLGSQPQLAPNHNLTEWDDLGTWSPVNNRQPSVIQSSGVQSYNVSLGSFQPANLARQSQQDQNYTLMEWDSLADVSNGPQQTSGLNSPLPYSRNATNALSSSSNAGLASIQSSFSDGFVDHPNIDHVRNRNGSMSSLSSTDLSTPGSSEYANLSSPLIQSELMQSVRSQVASHRRRIPIERVPRHDLDEWVPSEHAPHFSILVMEDSMALDLPDRTPQQPGTERVDTMASKSQATSSDHNAIDESVANEGTLRSIHSPVDRQSDSSANIRPHGHVAEQGVGRHQSQALDIDLIAPSLSSGTSAIEDNNLIQQHRTNDQRALTISTATPAPTEHVPAEEVVSRETATSAGTSARNASATEPRPLVSVTSHYADTTSSLTFISVLMTSMVVLSAFFVTTSTPMQSFLQGTSEQFLLNTDHVRQFFTEWTTSPTSPITALVRLALTAVAVGQLPTIASRLFQPSENGSLSWGIFLLASVSSFLLSSSLSNFESNRSQTVAQQGDRASETWDFQSTGLTGDHSSVKGVGLDLVDNWSWESMRGVFM